MYRGGQRLAALLAAFVLFISCDNVYENPVNQNTNPQTPKYVTVSGSITTRGALPSQLVRSLRPAENTRTAFATLPTLTSENYIIKAKNQATGSTEEYTATVAANCASYTVGIPDVAAGKSFKIFAEVSGDYGVFLTGETSTSFTLSTAQPVNQEQNITLKASQTSGTGIMVLTVTVAADAGISSARVRYGTSPEYTKQADISSTTYTFSIGQVLGTEIAGGLSCGAYPMTFEFWSGTNCSGTLKYSFKETVNIFANMKTDTWVQNGAEPWFTTTAGTTTCQVTKALVEGYELTDIYVDADAGAANNSGTFLKPLNDLAASLAMPHNTNKDYTIHIKGTFTGHYTIETSTFKSLTLCGESGLDTNEQPVACIDGNQAIGSTLTINTTKSVTIKSLKITGGKATQGGGINLTSGTLTLAEDSLITGNRASTGGGVYVATGDDTTVLNVTSNATVLGNTNMADTPSPSNVHLRGDKKINVTGTLKKGSGASAKKAKIGVSTATVPSLTSTKIITNGYGWLTGGKNAGVGPWNYFYGDKCIVANDETSGEAILGLGGGTLTLADVNKDIEISVDKSLLHKNVSTEKLTFKAYLVSDGIRTPLALAGEDADISLNCSVYYYKDSVPSQSSYWTWTCTESDEYNGYLKFGSGMATGIYNVDIKALYQGKTYNSEFEVRFATNGANLSLDDYEFTNSITISDSSGMDNLAQFSAAGKDFTGKTIILEDDVYLSPYFTPIELFKGTFDGNNKTISGLAGHTALFGTIWNGTVKNLTVCGNTTRAGIAVTLTGKGIITDCKNSADVFGSESYVGGIVAKMNSYAKISNCVNEGAITSSEVYVGGIAGIQEDRSSTIDSCVNLVIIVCNCENSANGYVGGIVGSSVGQVRNCINKQNVTAEHCLYAGGIVGIIRGSKGTATASNAYIINCTNNGNISSKSFAGGIAGYGNYYGGSGKTIILNCYNTGSVQADDNIAGGITTIKSTDTYSSEYYLFENNYYKPTTASVGVNGVSDSESNSTCSNASSSIMNNWVDNNNSDSLYKTWVIKNSKLVPDLGFDW